MSTLHTIFTRTARIAAIGIAIMAAGMGQAQASLLWNWSYSGAGITAIGTFLTTDTADGQGFYEITSIAGTRNGEVIIGLQTTGTPIPGNEPFNVDNLVRLSGSQLTGDGFGYQTTSGNYASPFFASFLPIPGYLEVHSVAPFIPGASNFGPEDSELPVVFSASLANVAEPESYLLMLAGLSMLAYSVRRNKVA